MQLKDSLLHIGGNTGKITEAYSNNCKDVVVLEPHRPNIKFIEGGAENIPLPDEYFDKVVASASFHHSSDQDSALEEMKRVLKPDGKIIILEIDPIHLGESASSFVRLYFIPEPNYINHCS